MAGLVGGDGGAGLAAADSIDDSDPNAAAYGGGGGGGDPARRRPYGDRMRLAPPPCSTHINCCWVDSTRMQKDEMGQMPVYSLSTLWLHSCAWTQSAPLRLSV